MKSLKQVISILVALAKSKSAMVKSRNRVIKAQLTISKLVRDKKAMMSVLSQEESAAKDGGLQVNVYNNNRTIVPYGLHHNEFEDYADESQSELGQEDVDHPAAGSGSVIDSIKCDYQAEGSDWGLENEIDKAADEFIKRIRRQMMIQKQESFKRYQEMLEESSEEMTGVSNYF